MSFHQYRIDELYSNASGTVQFIELSVDYYDGESYWSGVPLTTTRNGITHTFRFPSNLPSEETANTTVLIATQGFANLSLVAPNFIIPDGFLFPEGGSLNYGGVDVITYPPLPADGVHSVNRTGALEVATPQNFAFETGSLPAPAATVVVTTFNPTDEAKGVAVGSNITFTFSEPIQHGTGDILLKDSSGATVASYNATSTNLSISGSTLTINPTKDLGIFTGYQVEIAAGAIKDMAGNNYAGESNYNFTTQTLDSLYHFSVVAFSAAPGATFMGQMAEAYNAGMTVKQIVEVFSTKPQFTSTYADSMTNADFATLLVANVVKDSASAATKAKAVDDIVSALMVWSRGETIYQIFGNLANMQLTDPDWGNTALQFNNQTAVARHFTEVMHNSTTDMPTLKAVVGTVTPTTDVSTPEHIATLIGIEVPGMH